MTAAQVPDKQELSREASQQLAVAQDFRVTNNDQLQDSAVKLVAIKTFQKRIDDQYDGRIAEAHKLHKGLLADKAALLAPVLQAEQIIKRAVLTYQQEEERKRLEAERKAQAEAERERKRLAEQAAAAEAKAKAEAEALRKQAEEQAAAGNAGKAAQLQARAAGKEQAGADKAAGLQTRAATVVAPVIPSTVSKVKGLSNRKTYKAVVTDKMAVLQAVVAGLIPIGAVDINESFLNAQARLQKESLNYPGVQVVPEDGLASRSA
jgi:hypothetical protein